MEFRPRNPLQFLGAGLQMPVGPGGPQAFPVGVQKMGMKPGKPPQHRAPFIRCDGIEHFRVATGMQILQEQEQLPSVPETRQALGCRNGFREGSIHFLIPVSLHFVGPDFSIPRELPPHPRG